MKGIGIARIGLVAAGLTATVLTTGAAAQEGELVKNFLGSLGVIETEKDKIDYRERAPLVLPPRMDLREPLPPGSAQARNPQWPNDPDVAARNRQSVEDATPITQNDLRRMNGSNTRLTIDEMRAGRRPGAEIPNAPVARRENSWIHPDILRAQEAQGRTTQVTADETARRSLTDPPSAYRQSATGQPIRGSFEPVKREDEADPKVFQRQMRNR